MFLFKHGYQHKIAMRQLYKTTVKNLPTGYPMLCSFFRIFQNLQLRHPTQVVQGIFKVKETTTYFSPFAFNVVQSTLKDCENLCQGRAPGKENYFEGMAQQDGIFIVVII